MSTPNQLLVLRIPTRRLRRQPHPTICLQRLSFRMAYRVTTVTCRNSKPWAISCGLNRATSQCGLDPCEGILVYRTAFKFRVRAFNASASRRENLQANSQAIAIFKDTQARRYIKQHLWREFQLARGKYGEIERQLRRDELFLDTSATRYGAWA